MAANGVELATAYVSIVSETGSLAPSVTRSLGGVPAAAKTAGVKGGKALSAGLGLGMKALAGIGAALAVGDFIKDSIAEARESQKVGAITTQIIKSTGGAAKVTAGQVGDLAQRLSVKNGVDDEAIQQGANLLLTFKNVKNEAGAQANIFDRATAAAVDLSAAGFGSITGSSKMLGKALNDPVKGITALSRAGVTFTQQQKDQIKAMVKSGDVLGAQKLILKEVESQVGGVGAASATAGEKAKVAFDNMKEAAGTVLLPALDAVQTKAAEVFVWLAEKAPEYLAKLSDFLKPWVKEIQKIIGEGVALAKQIWKTFGKDIIAAAQSAWDLVRGVIDGALTIIRGIIKTVMSLIKGDWKGVWEGLGMIVRGAWTAISAAVKFILTSIGRVLDAGWTLIKLAVGAAWRAFAGAITGAWNWIRSGVATIVANIKTALSTAWTNITTKVTAVWRAFGNVISGTWKWISSGVQSIIRNIKSALATAWTTITTGVTTAWQGIGTAIRGAWSGLVGWISGPIDRALQFIQENLIDKINGMFEFLHIPLHISPIWKQGNVGSGQRNAGRLGTSRKLGNRAFARGGVMPGWTPGRDVHEFYSPTGGRLSLSGGEGILIPQATRGLGGARGIAALNDFFRRGQSFSGGGIFEGLGNLASNIWGAVTNPVDTLKHLISNVLGSLGNNPFVQMAGGMMGKVMTGLLTRLQEVFFGGGGGGSIPAVGVDVNGQRVDSDTLKRLRAAGGFRVIQGSWSHNPLSMGTHAGSGAVDLRTSNWGAGVARLRAQGLLAMFRNWTGNQHIHALNPWVQGLSPQALSQVRRARANHGIFAGGGVWDQPIHVGSYDQGGFLRPGWNLAHNGLGRPEPVGDAAGLSDRDIQRIADAVRDGSYEGTHDGMAGVARDVNRRRRENGARA